MMKGYVTLQMVIKIAPKMLARVFKVCYNSLATQEHIKLTDT
jgi:hypothetical protein